MSSDVSSTVTPYYRLRARHHLGDVIIEIELTLISVVAGVLLFVLSDYSAIALREEALEQVPYILTSLILIGWFWTEVVGHSLVFVSWPIDLVHNLLYLAYGLGLGIQVHFVADPRNWFLALLLAIIVGLVLVGYDLSLLESQLRGATGAGAELYRFARRRQTRLFQRLCVTFVIVLITITLFWLAPQVMLAGSGHILAIAATLAASAYFLRQAVVTMILARDKILDTAAQELAAEEARRVIVPLPSPPEPCPEEVGAFPKADSIREPSGEAVVPGRAEWRLS